MKRLCGVVGISFLLSSCCWFGCKHTQEPVIINILDQELYNDCHIAGSINIPFEQLESRLDRLDKQAETIVYCSNYQCTASAHAARILKEKGFSRVYAYEAGMAEWYQQKLPVVGACKESYLTVVSKPIGEPLVDVPVITTQELKHKIDAAKTHEHHCTCEY